MSINLPNQITIGRLIIALICLALLETFAWPRRDADDWMVNVAFVLFLIAALSDILDGYLARKQNQVTSFGRILDPFVDKLLVCGAFVLLLGRGYDNAEGANVTGLAAWMVLVVISRELLVSGLRGFSESQGTPYAANFWGKAKMVTQSVTVLVILSSLGYLRGVAWVLGLRAFMIWVTVVVTILSVFAYLWASRKALAEQRRG